MGQQLAGRCPRPTRHGRTQDAVFTTKDTKGTKKPALAILRGLRVLRGGRDFDPFFKILGTRGFLAEGIVGVEKGSNHGATTSDGVPRGLLLLQGRYKAIVVKKQEYAQELSRHIHLNPVRVKMAATPGEYVWSSCRAYIGQTPRPSWLQRGFILSHFGADEARAQGAYRDFVEGAIGREYGSPLDQVTASTLLGGRGLVEWVRRRFVEDKPQGRDVPALRELAAKPALEEIQQAVEARIGADRRESRRVALYLSHRYSGRKLKEIGDHFQVGDSGVTKASGRVASELDHHEELRRQVEDLVRILNLSET